ncbi:glycosyltransferase family 32 protein [Cystobasidium minutum MCA 4210]|uniref:glycosyltransferase family 32 protein n=1 Tax=Cystobasidium minutum MCA 4210 TaxID=1397322 RepID=UPI0034CE5459|eukprot:jgi/Rhomi1/187432/estExt_fgenesh1_pg.C_1_t20250
MNASRPVTVKRHDHQSALQSGKKIHFDAVVVLALPILESRREKRHQGHASSRQVSVYDIYLAHLEPVPQQRPGNRKRETARLPKETSSSSTTSIILKASHQEHQHPQSPALSSSKRLVRAAVGATARAIGAGGPPEQVISSSNGSSGINGSIYGASGSVDGGLNPIAFLYKADSNLPSSASKANGNAVPFPSSSSSITTGDQQYRGNSNSNHSSRRSRDLKHERQFGSRSSFASIAVASSSGQAHSDNHQLYGQQASRPKKMRAPSSTAGTGSNGTSTSTRKKKKADSAPITTAKTVSSSSFSRKFGWKFYVLILLSLVIIGTFTVLRTVVHFFGVQEQDVITLEEVQSYTNIEALPYNAELSPQQAREEEKELGLKREKIPRIIHQTWKSDILPERWEKVRNECLQLLPDFEFKLWSDADARRFIAAEYPSFLTTWDSYPFTIQRADAIRYFVLHKYGGIYMDLDIGCRAHPGPLLHFESILPLTKPVGVSNDLMFSAPKTPFMDLVINSLETFNHEWLFMPYPTVMFSTGPMFISAIYSMWGRILQRGMGIDPSQSHLYQRVRILPKSLYGKNILPEDAPHSFYWHYYGSSWHAGDAGFIGFLGKYGYRILLLGCTLVVLGFGYLLWSKRRVFRSPRYRKISLDPFEDLAISPPAVQDNHKQLTSSDEDHSSSFLKTKISHLTSLFKHPEAEVAKGSYMPLGAVTSTRQIRQRSNTMNSDSMDPQPIQSSMLPASPGPQPPRRKPRIHPVSTRPHSRQRSRDIERGSPLYSSQFSPNGTERQSSWNWPEPSATANTCPEPRLMLNDPRYKTEFSAEPEALTPPPNHQSLPSMTVTGPCGRLSPQEMWSADHSTVPPQASSSYDGTPSSPSSIPSSLPGTRPRPPQRPSIRPLSSNGSGAGSSFSGRLSRMRIADAPPPQEAEEEDLEGSTTSSFRTRKSSNTTTDGDVSASELMDTLTELEPLANGSGSASARTGISTPGERVKEAYIVRKRSLSSEGERFRQS